MARLLVTGVDAWSNIDQENIYQGLYVTEDRITTRVLIKSELIAQSYKAKDDLLTHDLLNIDDQAVLFNIDGQIYSMVYEGWATLNQLQLFTWQPHADVRLSQVTETNYIFSQSDMMSAHNILADSYNSRLSGFYQRKYTERGSAYRAKLKMVPKSTEDNFLTVDMQYMVWDQTKFHTNLTFDEVVHTSAASANTFWDDKLVKLEITGPSLINKDEMVELQVKAKLGGEDYPLNNHYIVEAVDGYVPHKRLDLVNGVGTIKVKALDLESGEKLRIKINTFFYSSLAEYSMDVI